MKPNSPGIRRGCFILQRYGAERTGGPGVLYHHRMRINADFSKPAFVIPRAEDWVHSPESGVDRLMLDRIGDEVARATSVVRYAPGSSFPTHEHAMGEEFLVLEGVFSDETGHFPAGTYVRNPPGSRHAPFSEGGCRILVKLRQFDTNDLDRVVVDTARMESDQLHLHAFGDERVEMRRLASGAVVDAGVIARGAEIFVVSGSIEYDGTILETESWLRLPHGSEAAPRAVRDSVIWLKSGHLPVQA